MSMRDRNDDDYADGLPEYNNYIINESLVRSGLGRVKRLLLLLRYAAWNSIVSTATVVNG
jgi:hypothetical protein